METAGGDPNEPLLAVRWDRRDGVVHVTRSILCRVQEGYDAGGGVFETRPAEKWVRELVGSIRLVEFSTAGSFRDELAGLLQSAVVGTSRLPLTSLESPLPQFTMGRLAYGYDPIPADSSKVGWIERLGDPALCTAEAAKRLEALLRFSALADAERIAAELLAADSNPRRWLDLLLTAFNGVSLTPYTDFVSTSLAVAKALGRQAPERHADFLARLAMLIDRHLCAYDLVKFHHRGANYPDALMLEELWAALTATAERQPALLANPRFRRAIRHALVLRLEYAGHPVPDRPTSIGDNARVLPAPFSPVDEEQIHAPQRRSRRIFEECTPADSTVWTVLRDLDRPEEQWQLGIAMFLHRPFGFRMDPTAPDRTPLISHRLFSRMVAERRLRALLPHAEQIGGTHIVERWIDALGRSSIRGIPLRNHGGPPKAGVVSLHDAAQTADDWFVLNTTRSSLRSLAELLDWPEPPGWRWLIPDSDGPPDRLAAFGLDGEPVARLTVDASEGFLRRGGVEWPRAGLLIERRTVDGWSGQSESKRPALE